jgi:uncharacterized HAD superfamily protein
MTFGADIDMVLADSVGSALTIMHSKFGVVGTRDSINRYEWTECFPVTPAQEFEIWYEFATHHSLNAALIPGGRMGIDMLRRMGEVWLITARHPDGEHTTKAWLAKHGIRYDRLIFCRDCKSRLAGDLSLMVEDRGETALALAQAGCPVALFDYAWNQGIQHPLIARVQGWHGLAEIAYGMARREAA